MLAIFAVIHAALIFHGQQVVSAAAQDGLREAQLHRDSGNSRQLGENAARRTLDLAGGLSNKSVRVNRGDDTVEVVVSARVSTSLFTFFRDITVRIDGPVERFYSEAERQ